MRRKTRYALLLALSAFAAPAANAATYIYTADLSGLNERPTPNASPGTGSTIVTYDDVLHNLRVQANFTGLLGTTTASHIHVSPPGMEAGGVATQTPTFAGFPLGVTSGSYDRSFDLTMASSWNAAFITANGGTVGGAEAAFFAGLQDGRAYLNIHSNLFPAGEIRGNLGAAVPEPAGWALMIAGFGFVGGAAAGARAHAADGLNDGL